MRPKWLQWGGIFFITLGILGLLASTFLFPLLVNFFETYLSPDQSISPGGARQLRYFFYLGLLASLSLGALLRISANPQARKKLQKALLSDPLYRSLPGQMSPLRVLLLTTLIGLFLIISLLVQDPESDLFAALYLEDGVMENLSAGAFLVSALFIAIAAFRIGKDSRSQPANRWILAFYLLLAGGLFFVGMEEISWGQRIIGWETPQVFAEGNVQDETNFHNFFNQYFPLLYPLISLILVPILLNLWLQKSERWKNLASLLLPQLSLIGIGILIAVVAIVWNHQEMIEELLSVFSLFYTGRLFTSLREPGWQRQRSPLKT